LVERGIKNEKRTTKNKNLMKIEHFEDIEGWQLGRELTRLVYDVTRTGGFSKDFGLKDQIQRASGSIMHNIAEGFDGGSNKEFVRFLRYSQRSCSEVQSELYVALDQKYIDPARFQSLYDLTSKAHSKIGGFIAYLLRSERTR
jgi:four helix bundle protein